MTKKLAVIRDNETTKCPYGLSVIKACKDIGDTIYNLQAAPMLDEKDIPDAMKRNKIIYATQKTGEKCPFADNIMPDFNSVNCDWGDAAQGEGSGYITPSDLYPRQFIGTGVNPNPRSEPSITDPRLTFEGPDKGTDVPFGLFSIFANKSNEMGLIKVASTNNEATIRDKIAILRNRYFGVLQKLYPIDKAVKLSDRQLKNLFDIIEEWGK